jgi:hypothetical protein
MKIEMALTPIILDEFKVKVGIMVMVFVPKDVYFGV